MVSQIFRDEIIDEVSTILSTDFSIDVTDTRGVPHSSDAAITFPNLDQKSQRTKLIETTVLYVDMRRSTQLNLSHRRQTVAKLYSAFIRAMTRCAAVFNGEVRGIIGDRVMILFGNDGCYENAIDTAILINSVARYVINKHFSYNEVSFGIGIDYGPMLATKTGIRRRGAAQQSYRSLVWLGRPANVASKLTDNANKPAETSDLVKIRVRYGSIYGPTYIDEYPHIFVQHFTHNPFSGLMVHSNPNFHSFTTYTEKVILREATPPILMTKRVYDGFRRARPDDPALKNWWIRPIEITIPEINDQTYGGDVIYSIFKR